MTQPPNHIRADMLLRGFCISGRALAGQHLPVRVWEKAIYKMEKQRFLKMGKMTFTAPHSQPHH